MDKPDKYASQTLLQARTKEYAGKRVQGTEKERWRDLRIGQPVAEEMKISYDESIKRPVKVRTKFCRKCHKRFKPDKPYYKFCHSCSKY